MRARALWGLALVALVALATPACAGDDNSLDGSVAAFYPLEFATVRARLYSSELAIEYVRPEGEAIVRLTVRRDESDPTGPGSIDLGAFGDITGSADGSELPPFVSGDLYLDSFRPEDGAAVVGSFDALLANGEVTITIFGTFTTRLDLVEDL